MAEYSLNVRLLPCAHTATEWASSTYKDKILKSGEIGYEKNTGRYKMGDGTNKWANLPWAKATPYGDFIPLNTSGGIGSISGGGEYGYCLIATIKISNKHINRPITFEISGRGFLTSIVQVMFQSIDNTDPGLNSFTTNGYNKFYIVKSDTSTWKIYGMYTGVWGSLVLHRITGSGSNIGITVNLENVDALPAGTTQASYYGNVSYATNAGSATQANKLTVNAGSSTNPIYFSGGVPTACSGRTVPGIKSASEVTTLGWGTNNNYVADISLLSYWNGAYRGTSSNLAYCKHGAFGTIVTKAAGDYLAVGGTAVAAKKLVSAVTLSSYDFTPSTYIADGGVVGLWNNNSSTDSNGYPAGNSSGGILFGRTNAAVVMAARAGQTVPTIYVKQYYQSWGDWALLLHSSNYTSYTVKKDGTGASGTWGISITGNASTATSATKATQDGNGSTITSTYLKLSGGTMSGNLTFASVTSTTYPALSNKIVWSGSTDGADIYYRVDANDAGRLVFNLRDDANTKFCFAYNGTDIATIDTSGNYSGKAAKATQDADGNTISTAYFRYRSTTSVNAENTLWTQIGSKSYHNALPDGLTGTYNYGQVLSFPGAAARFEIYASHHSSNSHHLYFRTGWNDDKQPWRYFIDSKNIGSQSVNYATSAGNASTASLLKTSNSNTTASASTWRGNITDGVVVWGEKFSNKTDIGNGDTGDITLWLRKAGSGSAATLNMSIDGNFYANGNNPVYHTGNKPSKSDVGLGNVDNTADANKSVKYATSASSATTASNANVLNQNTRMDYGWNGVNYFNVNGTAGNAAKANDTPTTAWWHILRFNHSNSNGFYTDLAVPFNANSLYYKRIANGAVQNGGWVKVLDALNYNDYAPKKDGTGASGTWGISITGNAATASKLAAARTLALNGLSNATLTFDGSANISADNWGYGTRKYVTQNSTSAPYFRIAYASSKGDWFDASMVFIIDSGYKSGGFGIVKVAMRNDDVSKTGTSHCEVKWLVREGFAANQIFIKGYSSPGSGTAQYADLYFKAVGTYNAIIVTALSIGQRGSVSRIWTFDSGDPRTAANIRTYNTEYIGVDAGISNQANTLTTARTINGTSFDGSANITTANWGTARTLTVGNTGKSVNGAGNVSWSLAEIGAVAKTGDTMTGPLTISHATTATMTSATTNPRIVFSENGEQPVILAYTNYDSYRSPAGLKVLGGSSASPAWFEVEGNLYASTVTASTFIGSLTGTATNAKFLANNTSYDYSNTGLSWFNADLSVGASVQANDAPVAGWWHMLRFNHSNSNAYYTDLAVPFNNNSLYYKCIRDGAVANNGWVKVLDGLNYSSSITSLTKGLTVFNGNLTPLTIKGGVSGNLESSISYTHPEVSSSNNWVVGMGTGGVGYGYFGFWNNAYGNVMRLSNNGSAYVSNDIFFGGQVSSNNGKVRLFSDSEGGNISLVSPNNIEYQIDTINGEFRMYRRPTDGSSYVNFLSVRDSSGHIYNADSKVICARNFTLSGNTLYITST